MSEQGLLRRLGSVMLREVNALVKKAPTRVETGETRFTPPPPAPTRDDESLEGWGFADTRFVVKPNGSTVLTGTRYNISNVELPELMPWFAAKLAAPLGYENRNEPHYPPEIPAAKKNDALL